MPLLKRRARRTPEIPTTAMADIAFLLLLFFLVTTTLDADAGLYMELPPKRDASTPPLEIQDRNLLVVTVDAGGGVYVEGAPLPLERLRDEVKRHVLNEGRAPGYADSPDQAVVSFGTARATRYGAYVAALDEIRSAYRDVRNDYAGQLAGASYAVYEGRLGAESEDEVARKYPIRIALAEPDAGP